MKHLKLSSLLAVSVMFLAMALLVACGGGDAAESAPAANGSEGAVGDAANGETLFNQATIGSANAPGCITCHSVEADVVLVGPSLAGVAVRAETAVSGMTAEEFLRQSIVEPNAHITEGFTEGIMYQNFGADLPSKSVDDLVAYLLTLQ